ncbi:MAG: ribonuclease P protein component [Bacteriovorax sp.]|jgi:ribonuclease P protein component|nr:ribonuclease P protein component [Bacteriovorax sp.]
MADSRFEKKFRLLSASDFSELKVDSLSFKKPSLIIYYKKNSYNQTRIGLSVTKKIGKAHDRNRLKRLLREAFRQSSFKFLGADVLVVVSWSRSLINESSEVKEKLLIKDLGDFFLHLQRLVNQSL